MSTVGFVLHPMRTRSRALFEEAAHFLASRGHDALELFDIAPRDLVLVVSLGGDGTMLRAFDMVIGEGTPVMGVNLGNLGYLAEVEPDEMIDALGRFLEGGAKIEERMTIGAEVLRGGNLQTIGASVLALNEIVVERASSGHVIRVDVTIDGTEFLRYDADGLIVSTPTGSTAYSLSARGPILAPGLRAIVVTPITPHMLFDRALVLEEGSELLLRICNGPEGSLMADGRVVTSLLVGDVVRCRVSTVPARLVRFDEVNFHEVLKAKFGLRSKWTDEFEG